MNSFKPNAPTGDSPYRPANFMYAKPPTIEAKLATDGADNFGPSPDAMRHGAVVIRVRLDDDDDDTETLKDELDLFRRENDFDLD